MRKILLNCMAVILILSLASCSNVPSLSNTPTTSKTDSSVIHNDTETLTFDKDKYVIQTPFYQIYEEGLQKYRYRIGTSKKEFVNDVKNGTEPEIDDLRDGIVRLFLGFGTNAFSVKYFDVYDDRVSKVINPFSIYGDYVNPNTEECLIAYFPGSTERPVLIIEDVFEDQGFTAKIERDFISRTCNKIIFLNENEVYLDYDVFAEGYSWEDLMENKKFKYTNVKEIVKFR